jgi:dTDP-4-dehydrorhamnose 3,5-epimerase
LKFTPTILAGAFIIDPTSINDNRGMFMRTYCKKEFINIGFNGEWVQMNHSVSFNKGTIRGMHFQKLPFGEVKMVKCIKGAILDVIVDIRKDSATFLQWTGVELTAENKRMLFIPEGFAHGFQTLLDNTELIYHHSNFFNPEAEDGLPYDDPRLAIEWPLELSSISDRDLSHSVISKDFKGI